MNKVLLGLLVTLLLAWWLFWPTESTTIQTKKPNTVSFVGDSPEALKNEQLKNTQPKPAVINATNDATTSSPLLTKPNSELSYVDVYRMKRLYAQCHDDIYSILDGDNLDPLVRFENNASHFIKNQPSWPTKTQVQAINHHTKTCEALLKQVQSLDLPSTTKHNRRIDYLELQKQLSSFLSGMKPDSVKARRLANVLILIDEWNLLYQHVLDLSKGDETLNAVEIENINAQIRQLRSQQQELSSAMQNSDRDSEQFKAYLMTWEEIRNLERKTVELKLIDPVARNQALTTFNAVNNELFNQLNSQDPDIFYETQLALERNTQSANNFFGYSPYKDIGKGQFKVPFIEYVSPGDVIKNLLDIKDDELFGLVIQYATQLYHCELGADCGPQSEWISFYCIKASSFMDPVSCDLDLTTFYQQHYLSPNQWDDVQIVLNLIRGLYAE